MRLPAITPAARAQRRADILARCISIATTPEQAERYRRGYQIEAARAASMTRTDVPSGHIEQVWNLVRRYRVLLLIAVLFIGGAIVWDHTASPWLQDHARWLAVGLAAGVWLQILYRWWLNRLFARRAETQRRADLAQFMSATYEYPEFEDCDEDWGEGDE